MVLTPRDTEMLRLVARHRFLRSTHLHSLLGGSGAQLLRRLQKLFHHGYLERPLCQLDYYQQGGSRPMVYGLSVRAAAYLRRVNQWPSPRFVSVPDNRSIRRLFLDHALMVSDILVSLERICRERGDVRVVMAESNDDLLHWQVDTPQHGKVGVVPDAVFHLQFPNGSQKDIVCCLEADRGTMPVVSHDPQRSSLARKFAAYEASWRDGVFRRQFADARVRVLTVTSSVERLASIHDHLRTNAGRPAIFVQTTIDRTIESARELLTAILAESPRDS